MATVIRRMKGKAIPLGAEIRVKGGKKYAHWTDPKGKARQAPLTKDGTKIYVRSAIYSIRYRDENGLRKWRSSGTRDKDAAKQIANQLETRAAQIRLGLISPADERLALAARRPLEDHLVEYVEFLSHKGDTAKHVRLTEQRIREILKKGEIRSTTGLLESAVRAAVERIRTAPKQSGKPALALGALNGYIRAISGFASWLYKDRRTPDRSLSGLGIFNAATDRRHVRRSLSTDEVHVLRDFTKTRPAHAHHASGEDRAMCYWVAVNTGYRASELKSVTTEQFVLDSHFPSLGVDAVHSKRRTAESQPLSQEILPLLRKWLATKPAGGRVFSSLPNDMARMMRSDLKAAREAWLESAGSQQERAEREASDFLKYRDAQGRIADFHSLRMTYVTRLQEQGVDIKTLQILARHSTPVLTMNTYTDHRQQALVNAVNQLGKTLMGSARNAPAETGGDYQSDYSQQAGGASGWQSGASSPVDREQAKAKPANEKTPAKPGEGRAPQGSSAERLRSESNRRWRICNPLP
jgi:integrase